MPYYKFKKNDVYRNVLKTFPSVKFLVYSGSAYYNNVPNISGAFADPIRLTDAGNVSLYEMNVDRVSSSTGRFIGPAEVGDGIPGIPDNGLIFSFVEKNGSRIGYRTLASTASWNESLYGTPIYGTYPYTSSISKEYYSSTTPRSASAPIITNGHRTGSVSHLLALKNTINHYNYINPEFEYSSSVRDFNSMDLGLISIPTIFYGSAIKKGSINLRYYLNGALLAQAKDENQDGVLYSTYGTTSGSKVGLALYNEGFLILTSSEKLSTDGSSKANYTTPLSTDFPKWVYFAQSLSGSVLGDDGPGGGAGPDPAAGPITVPNASFIMEMSGTTHTPTLTMFASAQKGQLNQSSNPTFTAYTTNNFAASSSKAYIENDQMTIKNVVSSAYADPTGSFEKTTYISKVGVYDKNKNLIAIAKVATPVRKTVERDFTFKIKLDL
jgi:hypothetical protein